MEPTNRLKNKATKLYNKMKNIGIPEWSDGDNLNDRAADANLICYETKVSNASIFNNAMANLSLLGDANSMKSDNCNPKF